MGDEEMEKFMSDPEFGAAEMTKMYTDFDEADADKDGKLNLEEWKTFVGKMKDAEIAKGHWWNPVDTTDDMYALHNRHTEGEGITISDFEASMGVWMEKWGPMREASRAQ